LERIRLRLLDLTNRNRLLNFRHPKTSSLRVVDELPDQLFERLRDGGELVFRPVPRPPQQDPRIEEDQPTAHSPTAKEYAESLGIAPSFELPLPKATPGANSRERHTDNEIQTLLYPEELERLLSKTANAARLVIEETGSNMLYLAFGFLEWYESDI